jgi:hypothetical protein
MRMLVVILIATDATVWRWVMLFCISNVRRSKGSRKGRGDTTVQKGERMNDSRLTTHEHEQARSERAKQSGCCM